jgi:broad specificity phosphatase PhoE
MSHVVHLLRHGEVFNPDRVLYGRLPGFGLSARGIEQAEQAAEYLAEREIGHLVASPLERAQQTARPLATILGLEIATD